MEMVILLFWMLTYPKILDSITIMDTYDYKRHARDHELLQEAIQRAAKNNKKIKIILR